MSETRAVLADGSHWPAQSKQMSFGLLLPMGEGTAFGPTVRFEDLVEMTVAAEESGFDIAWYIDHFVFRMEGEERGVWECWTMMAGAAARTSRIGIGSLVACTGFRNPGVIAKMTEAIDEISGGRFILGLGAGWHQPEYDMYGFPFDHRVTRFEEAMEIIHPLLRTGAATVEGRFSSADDAVNRPRGPRPEGAPILVGSSGERMLRIIARYADAWNTVWHAEASAVAPLMAQVDEACREVGRDPQTLVRTAGGNIALDGATGVRPGPISGSDEEIAATLREFRDLGITHFVCALDPCTPETIRGFQRIIDLVGE
jgi:alkanesulfonate monooxygenase SsuD/methylene tetrahydromethanopterin reductase-like flavin-dependent oxidoreductase (luciferase family)